MQFLAWKCILHTLRGQQARAWRVWAAGPPRLCFSRVEVCDATGFAPLPNGPKTFGRVRLAATANAICSYYQAWNAAPPWGAGSTVVFVSHSGPYLVCCVRYLRGPLACPPFDKFYNSRWLQPCCCSPVLQGAPPHTLMLPCGTRWFSPLPMLTALSKQKTRDRCTGCDASILPISRYPLPTLNLSMLCVCCAARHNMHARHPASGPALSIRSGVAGVSACMHSFPPTPSLGAYGTWGGRQSPAPARVSVCTVCHWSYSPRLR